MSLIYFHRFLILTAILFSFYFAWRLFERWRASEGDLDLVLSVVCVAIGVALAFYLRTVRLPRRRDEGGEVDGEGRSRG